MGAILDHFGVNFAYSFLPLDSSQDPSGLMPSCPIGSASFQGTGTLGLGDWVGIEARHLA